MSLTPQSSFQVLDALKSAVEHRTPISFSYSGSNSPGPRVGNPHAVFDRRKKNGDEEVYFHLWQTGGVSDSGGLPAWRMFFLSKTSAVEVDPSHAPFRVADGYNPASYEFPLAKV